MSATGWRVLAILREWGRVVARPKQGVLAAELGSVAASWQAAGIDIGPAGQVAHWYQPHVELELEVVLTSTRAKRPGPVRADDLTPLDDLIRQTPGAHPIGSVDELRCDAFQTDNELDEFLAFVVRSRNADIA